MSLLLGTFKGYKVVQIDDKGFGVAYKAPSGQNYMHRIVEMTPQDEMIVNFREVEKDLGFTEADKSKFTSTLIEYFGDINYMNIRTLVHIPNMALIRANVKEQCGTELLSKDALRATFISYFLFKNFYTVKCGRSVIDRNKLEAIVRVAIACTVNRTIKM